MNAVSINHNTHSMILLLLVPQYIYKALIQLLAKLIRRFI